MPDFRSAELDTALYPWTGELAAGSHRFIGRGHRPFKPFSDETIKVLNVGKVFENSAARIFYAEKPSGNSAFLNYHIEVPGKVNSCIAQITLPADGPLDDAKKIALSLSRTP